MNGVFRFNVVMSKKIVSLLGANGNRLTPAVNCWLRAGFFFRVGKFIAVAMIFYGVRFFLQKS